MKRFYMFVIVAIIFSSCFNVASAQNSNARDLQLYWLTAGRNEIARIPLDGTASEDTEIIFTRLEGWPLSIDFDFTNRQMYWTQDMKDWTKLLRANLDGTNKEGINVRSNVLEGFIVDSRTQKMYWVEDKPHEVENAGEFDIPSHTLLIKHANLDGSNIETIISNDQYNYSPGGLAAEIALDYAGGKIYWLSNDDTLYRANLNGTNIEELFSGTVNNGLLYSFALDTVNRKLYMTGEGIIRSANLDATNIDIIVKGVGRPVKIVLDVAGGKMYWHEYIFSQGGGRQFKIQRANLNGTNVETLISGGSELITDIALGPPPPKSLIPDPNLEAVVRKSLGLDANTPITKQAMQSLTNLEAIRIKITNLTGLEHATRLRNLNIQSSEIRDLTPIGGLTQLTSLILYKNKITDISPLAGLVNLTFLSISSNRIKDVSPIESLFRLKHLSISHNRITNVSPLAGLIRLEKLVLSSNKIGDVSSLAGLTKLEWLFLKRTHISNIRPLTGMTQLERLALTDNQIRDVTPLAGMTQLNTLYLEQNQISDISSLAGLKRLKFLRLTGNNIRDVSPLAGLKNLGKLWLAGNPIQDTSPLASLKKLTKVDIEISAEPEVHVGPAQRPPMYWVNAETGTLYRLIGKDVENFIPQVQNATSFVVDPTNNIIYWTEQLGRNKGSIKRANLDGSNVQVLATPNGVPRSIAVDSMQGKLYWTDSRGRIQRSNLNGRQIRNLIRNLDAPETITVDVAGEKLYWTEASGRIRSASLNGKSIKNIASGLGTLSSITISGNKIYYGTTLPGESRGSIGRANLNGSNLRRIASLQSTLAGIAIDPVGNKLYWTESDGYIRRGNLNGRNIQEVVSGLASPAYLVLGSPSASTAASANSSLASSETFIPDVTDLLSNYPNPFNPETWIPYKLAKSADVRITIYNVRGTVVRHLELGHQAAGVYQSRSRAVYWDGRNALGEPVASGVYFYSLTAGEFIATRKMMILK